MRVLQVTPRYPPRTGGVENHVEQVSERLVDRGHDVTVHTADAGPDVAHSETRNGVAVRRHRALAPGGAYHLAPGVLRSVRRADADVVHAHNYHSFPLLLAAAGARCRVVATPHYHGGSASRLRDALLRVYRPAGGWALGRADAVVAVSEWERDRLAATFGLAATHVPNGVDVGRFAAADPEVRDRPYLLTVGRLEAYKGVQFAVDALAHLPEFDLLIAGEGPYAGTLRRRAAERGVADRTEFLGYVDHDRLPGLYAGASAHLTLSEFEAYGLTVAEALAAGTSCVVHEAGALADWVGETGCVGVPDRTPDAVAAAVREAAGTTVDVSLPTWDDVVADLEALYRP
jgi:glycosyltransferase involved in cell wall biosynthesis